MRRCLLTVALTATVAAPVALAATPAWAGSDTRLTFTKTNGISAGSGGRQVHLTCFPTGGDHPKAQAACDAIDATDGRLFLITGSAHCPGTFRPVTVTVRGTWRGRDVYYRQTFPNRCFLDSLQTPVYDF
jgi:hypothetical protein